MDTRLDNLRLICYSIFNLECLLTGIGVPEISTTEGIYCGLGSNKEGR